MTGAGFGAALADATALADAVAAAGTSGVARALASYEQARLEDARRLVRSGQQFSLSFARRAA